MKFQAICAAAMLAASAALATEPLPAGKPSQSHAPRSPQLDPGRSAGVHRAQQVRTGLLMTGAAGVIAAVVLAATTGGGGAQNQTSPQMNNDSITTSTTTS